MPLDPVITLQQLIRTPSVNPMGCEAVGPVFGECRMTDLLVRICDEHGWPWMRQPVHERRDNLLALIEGDPLPEQGGELLLWDVHQDTVSADGMTVAPFGGEIVDGRVYGRGACDVKGPMAAMLAALSRVTKDKPTQRPTIVLACTANEECGFTGARAVADLWHENGEIAERNLSNQPTYARQLFCRVPDAAIVAEPTAFNAVVAHHGVVRWRCHTIGLAAHTSRPDMGVNAIYAMAQVVRLIERFHIELATSTREHPLTGRPSVCVSTIHGGTGVNTVPERATIEIDRRLAPSDSPQAIYRQLIEYIAAHADVGRCLVVHDPPFMQSAGLIDQGNRGIAERLQELLSQRHRESRIVGAPYGTDAAAIAAAGVPTVVFGPGSIEQAHTADEYIDVDELRLGADVFYEIACRGLQ